MNKISAIESVYYPILAKKGDESSEQILSLWDAFDNLSVINQEKVSSIEIAKAVKAICSNFNVDPKKAQVVSISIRDYYLGSIKDSDLKTIYLEELKFDEKKSLELSESIKRKIIGDETIEKKYQSQFEEIMFRDAMKKYPEIGEQLITTERLKVKNLAETIKPSIKNWLVDYTGNTGYESHDAMKRGMYLFQKENTKVLSSADRQKLAYILKAFDENGLVKVNTNLKQILFPYEKQSLTNMSDGARGAEKMASKSPFGGDKKNEDSRIAPEPIKIRPSVIKKY